MFLLQCYPFRHFDSDMRAPLWTATWSFLSKPIWNSRPSAPSERSVSCWLVWVETMDGKLCDGVGPIGSSQNMSFPSWPPSYFLFNFLVLVSPEPLPISMALPGIQRRERKRQTIGDHWWCLRLSSSEMTLGAMPSLHHSRICFRWSTPVKSFGEDGISTKWT